MRWVRCVMVRPVMPHVHVRRPPFSQAGSGIKASLPLKLGASAFTSFGILAAIVGAVGLYSVLSYLILEQRRMHAIKLAIGASPSRVARSVVIFSTATAVAGIASGYVALVPVRKILEPILFHTKLLEPFTVASVVVLGAVIALAASFFPVRTVLRTDVMSVLREQ